MPTDSRSARQALAGLALLSLLVAGLTGCAANPGESKAACPGAHAGQLNVVAATQVWANIAQEIGGSAVRACAIIGRSNQDPHSYEATVRDQLQVNRANLTIENGADYDAFFAKLVAAKPAAGRHALNLAEAIGVGTKAHPDPNPHLWYDFRYVREIAGVIARAEQRLAPKAADAIATREAAFRAKLETLIADQARAAKLTVGRGVILTEGFAARLLRNLALTDLTPQAFRNSVEQEQDASPAVMRLIRREITSHQVGLVITNLQTEGAQTAQIEGWARTSRVPTLRLSELLPSGQSYLGWMARNLNQIASVFK